jgi:NDP-sugar pyrophosphorylase family protein
MKTLLICPNQASGIAALADSRPAATLPLLGEHFLGYWMRYLAAQGVREARIITRDPIEQIEEFVGDGSRWGMKVEVRYDVRDLTAEEARKRHRASDEEGWAAEPNDVILADHLPGLAEHKLFTTYRHFFDALGLWMPYVVGSKRIGLREVAPGVWAGRKAHIARTATVQGPCWIGENVRLGKGAVIGPNSFLEDRVVLDQNAEVRGSWIAPDTFIGALTQVNDSLAWGNLLINWRTDSHTLVPDSFLMSSLAEEPKSMRSTTVETPARSKLVRPFAPVISLAQKLQS